MGNITKAKERIDRARASGVTDLDLSLLELTTEDLEALLPGIEGMPITELDLSDNEFITLPESIGKLSTITELKLFKNKKLRQLPESIGNLSKLTHLNVSRTNLKALPESIGNLRKLVELDIWRTELEALPESIGSLSDLTGLSLMEMPLKTLPESIGNLSNLVGLTIRQTRLTQLPQSIGNLPKLSFLNISGEFETLPESIGNLSALTELNVSKTRLTELPESISNLSSLIELNASGTSLTRLSESIGNLSNLTHLKVSRTRLTELPQSIGNLSRLRYLDGTRTSLENVPETLAQLQDLRHLPLTNCPLTDETIRFLIQNFPGDVIHFNMAAHDTAQSVKNVLQVLYDDELERNRIMTQLETCDLDPVIVQTKEDRPGKIPQDEIKVDSKEALQEFLSKAPVGSKYNRDLYILPIKGVLDGVLNPEKYSQDERQHTLAELSVYLRDCTTPVKRYLEQKRMTFLAKDDKLSDKDELIIERLAVELEVSKLVALRSNEKIEQVQALLNLVYSPGQVNQDHIASKVPVPNVQFIGERKRNLPSTSNYTVLGFNLIKNNPELIQQFANLMCETKDDKPIQTDSGQFKLDEEKIRRYKNNYISDLGLATGDQLERKKLITQYAADMERFIYQEGMRDLLYINYFEETRKLVDMDSQQKELQERLEKKRERV